VIPILPSTVVPSHSIVLGTEKTVKNQINNFTLQLFDTYGNVYDANIEDVSYITMKINDIPIIPTTINILSNTFNIYYLTPSSSYTLSIYYQTQLIDLFHISPFDNLDISNSLYFAIISLAAIVALMLVIFFILLIFYRDAPPG
jgi:hypothetical protein